MSTNVLKGGFGPTPEPEVRVSDLSGKLELWFPKHWNLPARVVVSGNLRDGLRIAPDPDQTFTRRKSKRSHYQVNKQIDGAGFQITAHKQFASGLPYGTVIKVREFSREGATIVVYGDFRPVVDTELTERHKTSVAHFRTKAQGELPLGACRSPHPLLLLRIELGNLNSCLKDIPGATPYIDDAGQVRVRIEL